MNIKNATSLQKKKYKNDQGIKEMEMKLCTVFLRKPREKQDFARAS